MSTVNILVGDVMERLAGLPDGSVHCVVTSPPYFGLRDYGTPPVIFGGDPACEHEWRSRRYYVEGGGGAGSSSEAFSAPGSENAERIKKARWREDDTCARCGAWRGQLGLEPTIELYIEHMTAIFEEVRRVLRDDGTCFINIGDCYAGGGRGNGSDGCKQRTNLGSIEGPAAKPGKVPAGLKPKDLVGGPWRLGFALQGIATVSGAALSESADALATARESGDWQAVTDVEAELRAWAKASAYLSPWWIRSDIIWHKPSVMPESVRDRPTKSHEYIFMLTKKPLYFFDQEAVREPHSPDGRSVTNVHKGSASLQPRDGERWPNSGRNIRTVWKIATQNFPGAHFAVFPEELPRRCIAAGTSEKGCCPECGAPWMRVVEKTRTFESGSGKSGNAPSGKNGPNLQGGGETGDIRRGPCVSSETIGWQPGCKCYGTAPLPGYPKDATEEEIEKIREERMQLLAEWAPLPAVRPLVLDPFGGAGTTGLVAVKMGRSAVLVELNPEYAEMAARRIERECALLTSVHLDGGAA